MHDGAIYQEDKTAGRADLGEYKPKEFLYGHVKPDRPHRYPNTDVHGADSNTSWELKRLAKDGDINLKSWSRQ